VLSGTACGTNIDHAVTAVGYGHDATTGKDYFKIRNSWGSSWGQGGYILLARGAGVASVGTCGLY